MEKNIVSQTLLKNKRAVMNRMLNVITTSIRDTYLENIYCLGVDRFEELVGVKGITLNKKNPSKDRLGFLLRFYNILVWSRVVSILAVSYFFLLFLDTGYAYIVIIFITLPLYYYFNKTAMDVLSEVWGNIQRARITKSNQHLGFGSSFSDDDYKSLVARLASTPFQSSCKKERVV